MRNQVKKTRQKQQDDFNEASEGGFLEFGLKKNILKGIKEAGFSEPSPIQKEAIPLILDGLDVIAQAQTGTGKTAAFALPLVNNLKHNGEIEALVLTPTRELAMQVSDEIFKLGKYNKVKTISLVGGQPIRRQVELLAKKPQVVIATPGRLLDHLRNDRLENFYPSVVVLDESDEMLDMGFLDDIEEIFTYLENERQTLLFSATMPTPIKHLAQKILNSPKLIKITQEDSTNQDITQRYYIINEAEREDAIMRLIDSEMPAKAIIFTRMKKEADILAERLKNHGYKAAALHGDMEQRERMQSMKAFKNSSVNILVATDIAARGLDISGVSHVFNFHIPLNPESYVHRIGRTGRAGKKGIAITLATPLEFKEIRRIKENTKATIELYEIPNLEDTLSKKDTFWLEKILKHPISDEALRVYEQIRGNADMTQLVCKLLSMVLKEQEVLGPNKIGLDKKDLNAFKKELEAEPIKRARARRGRQKAEAKPRENRGNKQKPREELKTQNKKGSKRGSTRQAQAGRKTSNKRNKRRG
ncbi:DEAD/DEAH box helicase [Helicobacter valdiviensis]|uniref:DEAD/DEAH box helicase n=1 Tax=Helicobacter valdiviensis TaxID=1458358 RepID=A0A2W6MV75_9HELI|nr:DEAD/DEAH box helicase [Helicobacter valdiviensis]PZT47871.1 DEAD/DEAH box helicase [Helicobacter valdiviensis]